MKTMKIALCFVSLFVFALAGCSGDSGQPGGVENPPLDEGVSPVVDTDGDGIADADDNCPTVANADQKYLFDTNGDGEVDACEAKMESATLGVTGTVKVLKKWKYIALGYEHTCGITQEGRLFCWGNNYYGQLGDGTYVNKNAPTQVGTDTDWETVAAGYFHTCATRSDKSLLCWGKNDRGQLGDPTFNNKKRNVPGVVLSMVPWKWDKIALGAAFSCGSVVDMDGLFCWGANDNGQLGDQTKEDKLVPTRVSSSDVPRWPGYSAGADHMCGISGINSYLYCWGNNTSGQFGIDMPLKSDSPYIVSSVGWLNVASGERHSCGIDVKRGLYCWGNNLYGQLGMGTKTAKEKPSPLFTMDAYSWDRLAAGSYHNCASISAKPELFCWGNNTHGQIGDGTREDRLVITAVKPADVSYWKLYDAGGSHTCAIDNNDKLWCWGNNYFGQVGEGTSEDKLSPVMVK